MNGKPAQILRKRWCWRGAKVHRVALLSSLSGLLLITGFNNDLEAMRSVNCIRKWFYIGKSWKQRWEQKSSKREAGGLRGVRGIWFHSGSRGFSTVSPSKRAPIMFVGKDRVHRSGFALKQEPWRPFLSSSGEEQRRAWGVRQAESLHNKTDQHRGAADFGRPYTVEQRVFKRKP